jgi:hypothetical protein
VSGQIRPALCSSNIPELFTMRWPGEMSRARYTSMMPMFLSVLGSVKSNLNWLCHAYYLYDQPLRPYYYLLIEIPVGNLLKFQGNNVTLISCFCLSPFRLFFLRSQQLETRPSFEPSKTLAFLFIRPLQKRRDCIILREAES